MSKQAHTVTAEKQREGLLFLLRSQIESYRKRLTLFGEAIAKDAQSALEWSQDDFRDAARLSVALIVVKHLEADMPLADILSVATREAMRGALYPQHSTSAPSNYAIQCKTAAWAHHAEMLENMVGESK